MYAAVRQCEIDAWEAIASFRLLEIIRFMDSCKNCGLELIGEELLSLDDKCGKCSVFKTLWKCNDVFSLS